MSNKTVSPDALNAAITWLHKIRPVVIDDHVSVVLAALAAERDRADRAEAAIAAAPHAGGCLSRYEVPCTCWKSEVIA